MLPIANIAKNQGILANWSSHPLESAELKAATAETEEG